MEPMTEATGKAIVERLDRLIELLSPKASDVKPIRVPGDFTEEHRKQAAEMLGVPYEPLPHEYTAP